MSYKECQEVIKSEAVHVHANVKKSKKSSKSTWNRYVEQYRESSTAHGIKYVLDFDSNFLHRFIW